MRNMQKRVTIMMENRGYPFIYEDSEWELFYVFLDETIQLGVPEADAGA